MTKPPVVKAREVVAALRRADFAVHHQTGSHVRLRHRDGRRVTVPMHGGDVPLGTLRRIAERAGIMPIRLLARRGPNRRQATGNWQPPDARAAHPGPELPVAGCLSPVQSLPVRIPAWQETGWAWLE
ncbi:MAG: type II toxin-antitoxin system HicA family toxin [Deltaproteobacteria bacterium]|nr:type II toxin-antitoxin system HicA family toxin [Deltaproteobacteria bacterium]